MAGKTAHFYDWYLTDDRLFEAIYAEYAEFGVSRFGLPNTHLLRLLEEPEFAGFLKQLNRRYGIRFDGAHAHWGPDWDPDAVRPENRAAMLDHLTRSLEFTAEFEAGLLVLHPGYAVLEENPSFPVAEMRQQTIRTLETLLPRAERLGVAIALENNISPVDTPDELLAIVRHFASPHLGCCFDSGHAHMMAYTPEKKIDAMHDFARKLWPGGQLQLYRRDAVEELAPYMICCHLHDNDGLRDFHRLPGDGTIDWNHLFSVLDRAPRLRCVQNEASPASSKRSIAAAVRRFRAWWEDRIPGSACSR